MYNSWESNHEFPKLFYVPSNNTVPYTLEVLLKIKKLIILKNK